MLPAIIFLSDASNSASCSTVSRFVCSYSAGSRSPFIASKSESWVMSRLSWSSTLVFNFEVSCEPCDMVRGGAGAVVKTRINPVGRFFARPVHRVGSPTGEPRPRQVCR